jgi:hypothetical protein
VAGGSPIHATVGQIAGGCATTISPDAGKSACFPAPRRGLLVAPAARRAIYRCSDEEPAVDVVNKVGPEYFVVSSDYPHSDGAFPEAIQQFLSLPLSGEARRKILWEDCARLYAIETPAMPLTQEQKTVSAAE